MIDNVLVAYELVHYLRDKRRGKKYLLSLKLDINKAYDMVKWNYLEKITLLLGFNSSLMNLIV